MRTASATPSIIVKVNKAWSQCTGDCSYSISNTGVPTITAASLAADVLTFTLSASATITEVSLAGQPCTGVAGTAPTYTCSLPKNAGNDLLLEAGEYLPEVLIENKGFANIDPTVNDIVIPITIDPLTPATGFDIGGTLITMTGTGFPFDSSSTFELKMCSKDVVPISVSNTEIKFYSAVCAVGASTVVLTFNGQTESTAYTYTAAPLIKIASITPDSHSPVLKGSIVVAG